MARGDGASAGTHCRFPRPRGDGPETVPSVDGISEFSPPTRGWPDMEPPDCNRRDVFPAHAGMARVLAALNARTSRFPRPRGDGPRLGADPFMVLQFSPPTRGWPVLGGDERGESLVFPAHAGMARRRACSRSPANCFPRPRGDGPWQIWWLNERGGFSPPTRGWPEHSPTLEPTRTVFPAHAGMARSLFAAIAKRASFPRPRGDGPRLFDCGSQCFLFSPPTRGWPGAGIRRCAGMCVFPAHAGMARDLTHAIDSVKGFPRPRGDGPHYFFTPLFFWGFSPPTRGWPA